MYGRVCRSKTDQPIVVLFGEVYEHVGLLPTIQRSFETVGSAGIRSHTDTIAKEDFMQVGYKESVMAFIRYLSLRRLAERLVIRVRWQSKRCQDRIPYGHFGTESLTDTYLCSITI